MQRDTKSYMGVLLDDDHRRPVARLHFNTGQEYLGLLDEKKIETRHAIESLDQMESLDPERVAAGHRLPGSANDATAIDHTRTYLHDFERILEGSADGAATTAALVEAYPDAGMLIAAQLGSKVAKGEMTWGRP